MVPESPWASMAATSASAIHPLAMPPASTAASGSASCAKQVLGSGTVSNPGIASVAASASLSAAVTAGVFHNLSACQSTWRTASASAPSSGTVPS